MKSKKNKQEQTNVSGDEYYPLDQDPEVVRLSKDDSELAASYLGYTSLAGQVERDSKNSAMSKMLELAEAHLLLVLQNIGYGRTKKPDDTGPGAN